jgi:hypothetical protein
MFVCGGGAKKEESIATIKLSRIILFNVSKFCKNLVSITGKTKEEV